MTSVLNHLQNFDLLHHLALCALFLDLIFVRRLDGGQLSGQTMKTEIDFAECTFPEDLPNFVKLDASFGHLIVLFEAVGDDLGE